MTQRKNERAHQLIVRLKKGEACFATIFQIKKQITVCNVVLNAYIERCVHWEKKVETERVVLLSVACSFRGGLFNFQT
jgi:hypothetical protein